MQMEEGGGDVLPGLGACEKPGGRVLDVLEPVLGFAGNPGQDSIAVVQTGCDEGVYKGTVLPKLLYEQMQ